MRIALLIILIFSQVSFAGDFCYTPENVGAVNLTNPSAFPEEYSEYKSTIFKELKSTNEEPSEFYVEINKEGSKIHFELWHKSAFYKENCGMVGNPGGLCRTIIIENGAVVSKLFWQ